jgi:hypothetical protein
MSLSLHDGCITAENIAAPTVFTADILVVSQNEVSVRAVVVTCSTDFSFDAQTIKAVGEIQFIQTWSVAFPDQSAASPLITHLKGMAAVIEITKSTCMIPAFAYNTSDSLVCVSVPCRYKVCSGTRYVCTDCKTAIFSSKKELALHLIPDSARSIVDVHEICGLMQ